jgi:hypothetical protein
VPLQDVQLLPSSLAVGPSTKHQAAAAFCGLAQSLEAMKQRSPAEQLLIISLNSVQACFAVTRGRTSSATQSSAASKRVEAATDRT